MSDVFMLYDGECPLCQTGARYYRIREAVGNLMLIDARTQGEHSVLLEAKATGLDVDQGMIVKYSDRFYHGADALHVLALLGTDSDWLNRLNAKLFSSPLLSRLSYPFLKAGRRLALWCKGVPPL